MFHRQPLVDELFQRINPDVQMLGALPRDVSIPTGFVGFAHARTPHRDAVTALLKYLSTADAAKVFTECGMTPGK